jgi:hypothetical protein
VHTSNCDAVHNPDARQTLVGEYLFIHEALKDITQQPRLVVDRGGATRQSNTCLYANCLLSVLIQFLEHCASKLGLMGSRDL